MNRITIIQDIINRKKAKVYLEIGVNTGACFFEIKASRKIGVDPEFLIPKKQKLKYVFKNISNLSNRYYEMTSDDFFAMKGESLTKNRLDVVFIDGLHTFEQSLKDVLNSLKFLKEDGVIVMHDCNPASEANAIPASSLEHAISLNLPGCTGDWNGDVWRTVVYLRSNFLGLNIFVLDCDNGLGIITRGEQKNILEYSPEMIKNLTYKDLKKDRKKLLNLKSLHDPDFEKFMETL